MNAAASFEFVEATGSTNADLALALRGANPPAEGHWLVAFRQSAGRGRQGREWFDGAGNFMGSTVVDLRKGDPPPATLAFVAALAAGRAVGAHVGRDAGIALKWPNDVLLNGGKVAGLLLEMVGRRVVVGIGVNLAAAPSLPDRPTAALSDVIVPPGPEDFAATLAIHMAQSLAAWREHGLAPLLNAFLERSIHQIGAPISVHDSDSDNVTGTFAGLDETDGALRLRLADGSERVIRAGDVS